MTADQSQATPPTTQPCTGPGSRTEVSTEGGVTRQTWHGCPSCHGAH